MVYPSIPDPDNAGEGKPKIHSHGCVLFLFHSPLLHTKEDFFMSTFITREDGYFALTKPGYIALVILMLIIMFLTAFIVDKKQNA